MAVVLTTLLLAVPAPAATAAANTRFTLTARRDAGIAGRASATADVSTPFINFPDC